MQFHQFSNSDNQVEELSNYITAKLNDTIKTKGRAVIAVSGGKSPINLFKKLSCAAIEWEKVTITLVDERFIDTTDNDSNEKLVRTNLLINNAATAEFIGLVTTRNIVASTANANLQVPQIDIAILGMGEDGHTASIFPCCAEINTILDTEFTTSHYVITTPESAPHKRIGLSLSAILEIPNLILSINGETKLDILHKAAEISNAKYPISYVLSNRKDLQVFWYK